MFNGVPVIATPVGGIPEILGHRYPLFMRNLNPYELVKKLRELEVGFDEIKSYLEKRVRYIEERWSGSRILEAFKELITEVIEQQ